MKKIPTLFERIYENGKVIGIENKVKPGLEEVLERGIATIKFDGACCAIFNGKFYKRYDAKKGKQPPDDAIPCCEPDSVTGHWPHWVEVDLNNPADKWFNEAYQFSITECCNADEVSDGTYEAVGRHFNGNPYGFHRDMLIRHGKYVTEVDRTYEGIYEWIVTHNEEGLVFWMDGEPRAKIKRSDFGLEWPIK